LFAFFLILDGDVGIDCVGFVGGETKGSWNGWSFFVRENMISLKDSFKMEFTAFKAFLLTELSFKNA